MLGVKGGERESKERGRSKGCVKGSIKRKGGVKVWV